MSESLKDLSLFCTVVDLGSFVAASEQLDLTPSAVSKAIARLEFRLGVGLFVRSTRTIRVTEAGAEFYSRAKGILAAIEEAESVVGNIASEPRGDLRVAASDAFATRVIVPMLSGFQAAYPRIQVHIMQGDGPIDLLKEDYDIAIRFEEPDQKSVESTALIDDPWVICASPEYLKGHSSLDRPGDLQDHRCIAIRARGRLDDVWQFRGGKRNQIVVDPVFSGIGLVVRSAALSGLGVARLANFLVKDDLEQGALVPLLSDYQLKGERKIYAVTPDRGYIPEKSRVFVDVLAAYVEQNFPGR